MLDSVVKWKTVANRPNLTSGIVYLIIFLYANLIPANKDTIYTTRTQ